jgi:hypothetical protein
MYSCLFNAGLLIFNLIPGYPLDGGRLAQAILWRLTGRRGLAAGIVTATGYVLAVGLLTLGIYELAARPGPLSLETGLLGIMLAVFLAWTARSNYRAARVLERVGLLVAGQAIDAQVRTLLPMRTCPWLLSWTPKAGPWAQSPTTAWPGRRLRPR